MSIKNNPVFSKTQKGEATYYDSYFEGRKTASGLPYQNNGLIYRDGRKVLTGAHMYLRFGTVVRVTNLKNGKYVDVVITDRGSFSHRNIDLSQRAFTRIAKLSNGRVPVSIKVIGQKNLSYFKKKEKTYAKK